MQWYTHGWNKTESWKSHLAEIKYLCSSWSCDYSALPRSGKVYWACTLFLLLLSFHEVRKLQRWSLPLRWLLNIKEPLSTKFRVNKCYRNSKKKEMSAESSWWRQIVTSSHGCVCAKPQHGVWEAGIRKERRRGFRLESACGRSVGKRARTWEPTGGWNVSQRARGVCCPCEQAEKVTGTKA